MNSPDRPAYDSPFLDHGGRLGEARARFPSAPEPWIDLSTGICPWPYPIPQLPAECWSRLPDPLDLGALLAVARATYGVAPAARLAALPGTDLAISLLPRLVGAPAHVAIVAPTYASHAKAWAAAGHRVRTVSHPGEIGPSEIGVVVNPNNPDGRQYPPALLRATASSLSADRFLLVDEAFCDVTPGQSVLEPSADLSRMLVLRSFGKFYGLAGLRLGFAASGHPIGAHLTAAASDWPVSGPAIAIGRTALGDAAWTAKTLARLQIAADRLDETLKSAGCEIVGGTSLFRLVRHRDAGALFGQLARRAILVRPFERDGLLRFGLPAGDAQFARLALALMS